MNFVNYIIFLDLMLGVLYLMLAGSHTDIINFHVNSNIVYLSIAIVYILIALFNYLNKYHKKKN